MSEIPKLGIDLTYVYSLNSYIDFKSDIGYNYNHIYAIDINDVYMPHIKCDDGIRILMQSGGFVKIGFKINARTNLKKRKYFSLGLNIINSLVYEKADIPECYFCSPENNNYKTKTHIIDVLGSGLQVGYNFYIGKINCFSGMQLATTTKSYVKLYSYSNFIPGIGYKSYMDPVFPTLFFYLTRKIL